MTPFRSRMVLAEGARRDRVIPLLPRGASVSSFVVRWRQSAFSATFASVPERCQEVGPGDGYEIKWSG